jgi:hypothetical protein
MHYFNPFNYLNVAGYIVLRKLRLKGVLSNSRFLSAVHYSKFDHSNL